MNMGYRVLVWHCVPVESMIVTPQMPISRSPFWDHVERR